MAPRKAEQNLDKLDFEEDRKEKRKVLEPRIISVVSALGGLEDVLVQHADEDGEVQERIERVYRLGDECLGCLKDLKKFWRLDDQDDDRTVARILSTSKVLPNDLLPILKAVDGTGSRGTRIALLCSDLIAALTWPIDVAAELRENQDLEDEDAIRQAAFIDYSGLVAAQLSYKRDIVRSGALEFIFKLILPALDKPRRDRTQKDENIISLILHVIRNLAALRDKPASASSSAAAAEEAFLQSDFILQLQRYHIWDFLLIVAHGSATEDFRPWNMVALDIFHLLFRGLDVTDLAASVQRSSGPSAGPNDPAGDRKLAALLEGEESAKRREARSGVSRHSRFGTTLSVQTGGKRFHLHHQSAITAPVEKAIDSRKRATKKGRGERLVDDLAPPVELKPAAMRVMREVATRFLESGFNPFFASILTDIRMEREKVREADTVRFLYLLRFFFEFLLALRAHQRDHPSPNPDEPRHGFDLIAEMTDPQTLGFVTSRMKAALDVKPVLWTELHAGVDTLIQLLLVIDELARAEDEECKETAIHLQNRLYYEGETLDLVVSVLVNFKAQSVKHLDSIVHLAFVLLKMLEKYSKSKDRMYIRKRKNKNRKKTAPGGEGEEGEEMDEEEQEIEDGTVDYAERAFDFEVFEARFADEGVLKTLMTYLKGFETFTHQDQMKRVVKLMHRQAVNAQQPNIFFKVSTLNTMTMILDQRKHFPRQPAFDDLAKLIDFIVKRFVKSAGENPFLLVDVFFPKRSKSEWRKAMGEGQSDDDEAAAAAAKVQRMPAELEVRPGLTWSQQVGVAIGLLVDANKSHLLDPIKDALRTASAARTAIVLVTDGMPEDRPVPETDEEIRAAAAKEDKPSEEALEKFQDHVVDAGDEEARKARAKDGQLQLLMRLIGWESSEDLTERGQLVWIIPRTRLHTQLDSDIRIIDQFLIDPLDHEGKSAAELVRKKRKPRTRKTQADADEDEDEVGEDGLERAKKRRQKRQEEVKQYKSAQFIADSDDEDDDARDEAFFERERQLQTRMAEAASNPGGPSTAPPRPTRVKPKRAVKPKTKSKDDAKKGRKKERRASVSEMDVDELSEASLDVSESDDEEPRRRAARSSLATSPSAAAVEEDDTDHPKQRSTTPPSSARVAGSKASRKRSLSTASSLASPVATVTTVAVKKARRVVLDSDE